MAIGVFIRHGSDEEKAERLSDIEETFGEQLIPLNNNGFADYAMCVL